MKLESERKSLDFYLNKVYPFTIYPSSEGGYSAEIPDLPGCLTEGESLEELARSIEDARRAWIEVAYEEGLEIPLPRNEDVYSGRFVVRIPKYLHRHLAEEAEREGVSLNQLVVALLSAHEGGIALTLHEEMADILRANGNSMYIVELANAVNRRGRYRSPVIRNQISARVNKKPRMFEQSDGIVRLIGD